VLNDISLTHFAHPSTASTLRRKARRHTGPPVPIAQTASAPKMYSALVCPVEPDPKVATTGFRSQRLCPSDGMRGAMMRWPG